MAKPPSVISDLHELALTRPSTTAPVEDIADWYELKAATLRRLGGHDNDAQTAHDHALALLGAVA
ncbi:MAG TPA: hypothetical protein VM490_24275 [Armatimonadaceae bacterium]|jgi:hypothetical protein|nr:hypothetical protein [Armatimonadaceae bacterium]